MLEGTGTIPDAPCLEKPSIIATPLEAVQSLSDDEI